MWWLTNRLVELRQAGELVLAPAGLMRLLPALLAGRLRGHGRFHLGLRAPLRQPTIQGPVPAVLSGRHLGL